MRISHEKKNEYISCKIKKSALLFYCKLLMGKDTSHNRLRKQPPKLIPTDGANSAPVSFRPPPHPLAELVVTTAVSVGGSNAASQPLNPIFFPPISHDPAAGDPPSRRRRSQRAFELSRRSLPSFATANF